VLRRYHAADLDGVTIAVQRTISGQRITAVDKKSVRTLWLTGGLRCHPGYTDLEKQSIHRVTSVT
jgi:hypothetical protein